LIRHPGRPEARASLYGSGSNENAYEEPNDLDLGRDALIRIKEKTIKGETEGSLHDEKCCRMVCQPVPCQNFVGVKNIDIAGISGQAFDP
jgi:hypothetical protein